MTNPGSTLAFRIVRFWLPVAVMIAAMYFLSTDVFSGEQTRSLLEQFLTWLRPGISESRIVWANVAVRKAAHFVEYAVLAALIYRAFRADHDVHWRFRWAVYALAMVTTWALVDEFHQSLTYKRGGSLYDAALDVSGGVFALVMIALYSVRRELKSGYRAQDTGHRIQ